MLALGSPMPRQNPADFALILIDIQDKLAPAMPAPRMASIERAVRIATTTAKVLKIPGLITEQYPKGLGATTAPIAAAGREMNCTVYEKTSFSVCGAQGVLEQLRSLGTQTVVLAGIETHICVYQSARDLREAGHAVQILADGVASRDDEHRQVGLELCRGLGATITTAETWAFELLGDASRPEFREISRVVR